MLVNDLVESVVVCRSVMMLANLWSVILMLMFVFWLVIAQLVYNLTLGPEPPTSLGGFAHDVLFTPAGWMMAILGIGVGFVFAVIALSITRANVMRAITEPAPAKMA